MPKTHRLTSVGARARSHYEQARLSRELLFMTGVLNLLTPKLLSAALDLVWPPILAGIEKVSPGQVIRWCQWSHVCWAVSTQSQ